MKAVYIIGIIFILLIGSFFIFSGSTEETAINNEANPNTNNEAITGDGEERNTGETSLVDTDSVWRTTELKDVKTGKTFTIDQFDKPILLESFAVWCPTCTRQQKEIKELHEDIGEAAISISLNTDPNEDEQKVLDHLESHGFDWYYAVAPKEVTQSLIDEFGITVANAPSAPVILIDENKNARLLHNGVKKANELKGELRL